MLEDDDLNYDKKEDKRNTNTSKISAMDAAKLKDYRKGNKNKIHGSRHKKRIN